MAKSGFIIGSIVGATAIILLFAFVFVPTQDMISPELIISNGHDATSLGDENTLPIKGNLTLIELFKKTEQGVVKIETDANNSLSDRNAVGSGFVYDILGHTITNAHVIDNATKVTVTFLDGNQYNAEIIGADKFTDIAVIKVNEKPRLLHPLDIGDSSVLLVGEQVAAIGNPFGLSGSMTSGIVSQLGRLMYSPDPGFSIPDVIQTDAAINPGNSGGPLLNMKGEVVGINTAIQSATGEFTGVGFAVPSNTVKKVIPVLIRDGIFHHPWMGISGSDVDPELAKVRGLTSSKGFLVATVIEGSPAEEAGLLGVTDTKEIDGREYPLDGDIIIKIDDVVVRKISDILIHLQREKSVGDEMIMTINRDGAIIEATLVLGERPQNE